MTKIILFILVSLSVMTSAAATEQQNGTVRGRIVDDNNLPLPGANVFIESLNKGSVTNVDGFYTIFSVPSGSLEVSVSYIGFNSESAVIDVEPGSTSVHNFTLTAGIMLGDVTIGYSLQGQARAMNQQRTNANITNIVASDQIGRFPDVNIGDALKRLPGINVQYDQGEARFGSIRGTESRLNSVTINGERMPSAEGSNRVIQLDLIPADMIQ